MSYKTGDLVGVSLNFIEAGKTTSIPVTLLEGKDIPEVITIMPGECDIEESYVQMSHL